ncbi:hypothetical protein [Streptomyces sp. NPDC002088]
MTTTAVGPAARLLATVLRRRQPTRCTFDRPVGRGPAVPDVWLAGLRLGG